jgi:hypothetical protein
MIALLFACATPPAPAPSLRSPDAEVRLDAFINADLAELNREADLLLEMTRSEPDDWLRREAIRQLGVIDDPRVLARLRELASGPYRSEALESMGYAGEAGCAAFADQWMTGPRGDEAEKQLFFALSLLQPQCRPAFQARCAEDEARVTSLQRGWCWVPPAAPVP